MKGFCKTCRHPKEFHILKGRSMGCSLCYSPHKYVDDVGINHHNKSQGLIPGLPSGSPAQFGFTMPPKPRNSKPAQDFVGSGLSTTKAGMASFIPHRHVPAIRTVLHKEHNPSAEWSEAQRYCLTCGKVLV